VGLYESLFQNLTPAVGAGRRRFQNVSNAWIRSGNAIEDVIERNLGTVRIAAFAGVDESLCFLQNCRVDHDDVLVFRQWIEEISGHSSIHWFIHFVYTIVVKFYISTYKPGFADLSTVKQRSKGPYRVFN